MDNKYNIENSPRKKQIIQMVIKDRKDVLIGEQYGAEMLGYESDDLIQEELDHLKEIEEELNL